mgnify:FL=1
MDIKLLFEKFKNIGINFYTGVPDSQLKALCDHVTNEYGIGNKHVIAANEGAGVGLAAGHYLATGSPALVYMQNSGIGNAINPICSLINEKVYQIPMLFVIGWRGQPGVKDEPQHIFQCEITLKLLNCLNIPYFVIKKDTTEKEMDSALEKASCTMAQKKPFALVVQKGALELCDKADYSNDYPLSREKIVQIIIDGMSESDIVVSTTGKLSRELFEARESRGECHKRDFLTVGSMGHSSMIAMGIAMEKPDRRIYCLDGDGATLMHMGSMAVLASQKSENIIHFVINNSAHETVGGMPTVSDNIDFPALAKSVGYAHSFTATNEVELKAVISKLEEMSGPVFVEVKANLESRSDLGRPTTTPTQNKDDFMSFIKEVF